MKKALANLKDNRDFKGLYLKALARSVADAVWRFLHDACLHHSAIARGYKGVLSVGRVQTPILGLIVNRTRANQNHKSSFYYTMTESFSVVLMLSGQTGNQANLLPLTDRKLFDKAWANGTAASLAGKPATVEAAATDDKNGCTIAL